MVTSPGVVPTRPHREGPWAGAWLPVADLRLADGRSATLSLDRHGHARLTLLLDRPAGEDDLEVLEDAADALPYLRLADLGPDLPERHAEAFALPRPLPVTGFVREAEIELACPPGGMPLPARLGGWGIPARHISTEPAPAPPPPRPARPSGASAALAALEHAGLDAGRGLVALTRTPAAVLCDRTVALLVAGFVAAFVWTTWVLHARFGTYGFDLGIFDQGTWLLSRLERPFVTIRGLHLFADHASYVLALVAPLYRVWADPRLLLLLQVVFLAVPAVVIYRVATRRLGHPAAGVALAAAYLAYPAMQWAATWQFHPETIAAGALALAVGAADRQRWWRMAAWLALALLCKEDVGLVVAGLGLLLWVEGNRSVGRRTLAAGLGWFLVATFVLVPMAGGGDSSPHFALNYGVTGSGLGGVLGALPTLVENALGTTFSNKGLSYLVLVFLPLLGLPLAAPRWLLPVAGPLFLNLAAVHDYQYQIRYQYLATSAPFLVLGAVAGLRAVASRWRRLLAPLLALLVLAAVGFDYRYGPAPWSRNQIVGPASPVDEARRQALAMVPPDAPVSAHYNLVTHLAHRELVYEFPNPFQSANWGVGDPPHPPEDVDRLRYVLVQRNLLDEERKQLLARLQASGEWRTRFDSQDVVLLERAG